MQQYTDLLNYRILVVDDSEDAVELMRLMLEGVGARVYTAHSGPEAIRTAFQHRPDAILLDLMMPEMDGFTTIRRLRELSEIPIIVVSGKERVDDIARALEFGADDYVVKPFDKRELLARVAACIRRAQSMDREDAVLVLCRGDLVIDLFRHRVLVRQKEVKLTRTEFELLHYLARNRNRVLPHSMILESVWGQNSYATKDTLKQFMFSLRKKIEPNPDHPQWLMTEHGIGYSLLCD